MLAPLHIFYTITLYIRTILYKDTLHKTKGLDKNLGPSSWPLENKKKIQTASYKL